MLPQPPRAPFTTVDPAHQGGRPTFISVGQRQGITRADNHHYAYSATSTTESYPGTYEVGGVCFHRDGVELIFLPDILSHATWPDVAWTAKG